MTRIAIVTDSSSGLSAELIAQHDLHVLPYYILAGGRMLRDGSQISREEVFRLLHDGRHLPHTKAPTQQDFAGLFRSLLGQVDAALVVLPTRERTAAYQHADLARRSVPDLPVRLLDSRQASAGQALVVLAAARARTAGGDLEALIAAAQTAGRRMEFWIVLESLRFAARSGRVPNLAQYVGSIANPVPVLRYQNGAPHVAFTAHSADQAIERLKAELADRVPGRRAHVAIAHAGDPSTPLRAGPSALPSVAGQAPAPAESIRAWAHARWSPVELHVLELPPIIAVYSGPGALGVAVYEEGGNE